MLSAAKARLWNAASSRREPAREVTQDVANAGMSSGIQAYSTTSVDQHKVTHRRHIFA